MKYLVTIKEADTNKVIKEYTFCTLKEALTHFRYMDKTHRGFLLFCTMTLDIINEDGIRFTRQQYNY